MKKTRLMLSIAMLSVAGLTTFTSCSSGGSGDEPCPVGYEGSRCDDEVREKYTNTYRGTGSDNHGGTYTNWALNFNTIGTDATKMRLQLLDAVNAPQGLYDITLTTNNTFTITPVSRDGFDYTGQGEITENRASLKLIETDPSGEEDTYIFDYSNMIKE